ncbi:MAG TPA: acyltransferase, partial [Verrucomicrobiae bacterium]
VLFFAFGNQKMDRIIGELSYPIYLLHMIVIDMIGFLLPRFGLVREIGIISALVSIILAAILYRVFIAPLDKKRHILTTTKLPAAAHA